MDRHRALSFHQNRNHFDCLKTGAYENSWTNAVPAQFIFFFNIEFLAEKKKPKISKSRPYALYSVPPTSPPIFSTDLIMWKTLEIHCTEDFVVPFAPLVSHREWNLPCRKMKGMSELMWTFKTIANLIGLGGPLFPLFFKSYFIMFTLLQLLTLLTLP